MDEIEYGPLTLIEHETYESLEGDRAYKIVGCQEDATRVLIPVAVNGIPVTCIGDRAFHGCTALAEVVFPDEEERLDYDYFSVEIGGNAFMNCTSLRAMDLPDYVAIIGHGAFYGCTALERVTIRSKHVYVAPYAFSGCASLREVTPLSSLNDGSFAGCASLTSLPITEEVDEIPEDCFEHCDGLVELTIPRHITCIVSEAFSGCYNLRTVTFEDPEGWYASNRYSFFEGKHFPLDLTDPERNAHDLAYMDFDDGIVAWQKKTEKTAQEEDAEE